MIGHLNDQLSAYLDDELNEEEKKAIEAHLESCESCQALLDVWLAMQEQVKDIFQFAQAPAHIEANVMATIERNPQLFVRKRWFAIPLIVILLISVFGITTGTMFVKFIHSFTRLFVAILYMATHFLSNVPFVALSVSVLSLIVLTASIYSLRKAFQPASMERG
ncbi:anti-sigma factor family protein [Paenibacillus kobensis]|uniref:anti-sigma factor family protein n=1 Tax=Paenibacillus kobensis TaxID=59841 RepID=UPI000FD8E27B|nr:zf-HC2 domain-containing protein [Paenibacillus kobensis]